MNDDTYIRNLRENLIRRSSDYDEIVKKENREAAIVKENAPRDWDRLKKWWTDAVIKLNAGLSSEIVTCEQHGDDFEFHCRIGREWKARKVEFNYIANVFARIASDDLTFDCQVEDGKIRWVNESTPSVRYSLEDIGREILTAATRE